MINIKYVKKLTFIFSICLIVLLINYIYINIDNNIYNIGSDYIENTNIYYNNISDKFKTISDKVKPYIVSAKVSINNKEYVGEVIEDTGNGKKYHIQIDDQLNWYEKYYVSIIYNEDIKIDCLKDEEIEMYVNLSFLNPTSDYFIWVDLYRIKTYLLKKENLKYKLIRTFQCATGKDLTPTKRGLYQIESKGTHFYSRDNTYICYNFMQYSGSYLLHSFPYTLNKKVIDNSVNKRVSNGCVRFSFDDSKYLFDNIPIGTQIWIN